MAVPNREKNSEKTFNLLLINKIKTIEEDLRVWATRFWHPFSGWVSCQCGSLAGRVVILVMTGCSLFLGAAQAQTGEGDAQVGPLRIGQVQIVSGDIFSLEEVAEVGGVLAGLRKAMNGLSIDTRQYVIRKELLFRPGDLYDPALLAETERNLRELGFLNSIRVAAIDTTQDGQVNIAVHTRESWTLQTSLAYARSSGGDTRWSVKLSEKNFLGHGLTLGAGLGADENSPYWNFWFRQRRLTRHNLQVGVDYSDRDDGYYRNVFASRPFYSQTDPWTASVSAWNGLSDARYYLSNASPAGVDPAEENSLYARIPTQRKGLQLLFQKRVSSQDSQQIWRLGAGLRITDQDVRVDEQERWELSDGRSLDLRYLMEPGQPLARDQGTTVYPFLWVHTLGRNWVKARFVEQYGPVEDIPLSWNWNLLTGPNGHNMGSTTGFDGNTWLTELGLSRWLALGPGLAKVSGYALWQLGSDRNRHHQYSLTGGWIGRQGNENHPWITRVTAEYSAGENLVGSQALLLGLSRGLRTLEFDGMAGDRLIRWNFEQGKATPWEVGGLFRMGAAVFYNGGLARWQDEDRAFSEARHEVGVGLRLGPTRSGAANVSRFDISWSLDGSVGPVFTTTTRGFF